MNYLISKLKVQIDFTHGFERGVIIIRCSNVPKWNISQNLVAQSFLSHPLAGSWKSCNFAASETPRPSHLALVVRWVANR